MEKTTAMIGFTATGCLSVKPSVDNNDPSNDNNYHGQPMMIIYPPTEGERVRDYTFLCICSNGNNNNNNTTTSSSSSSRVRGQHSGVAPGQRGMANVRSPTATHVFPLLSVAICGNGVPQLGQRLRPCSVYPWMQLLLLLAAVPASPWDD